MTINEGIMKALARDVNASNLSDLDKMFIQEILNTRYQDMIRESTPPVETEPIKKKGKKDESGKTV